MNTKIRLLTLFTVLALVGLVLFGKTLPVTAPQSADAKLMPSSTPQTPTATATATATFIPTSTPSPTTTPFPTPTASPIPTNTPRPTRTPRPTPTPTPDMTILDQHLETNTSLQQAICQPDKDHTVQEGQIIVPIILYHFVGRGTMESNGHSASRYNVTQADFDTQLAILHQLGYQTVTISEVARAISITNAISGTSELPPRPIAITVDDGWVEQYTNIFPALKKYDMNATFYVPSTYPIGGRFVTWEQLKEMVKAGMEIGSHTRKHVDLVAQSTKTALYELTQSKQTLEEKLGVTIHSISYPFGNYSSGVIQLTQQAGYDAAVALSPTPKQSIDNLYRLNRIEIFGTHDLVHFVNILPWRGQGTAMCPETQIQEPASERVSE